MSAAEQDLAKVLEHLLAHSAAEEVGGVLERLGRGYSVPENFGPIDPESEEPATEDQKQCPPLELLNSEGAAAIYTPLKEGEIRLVRLHPETDECPIQCSLLNVKKSAGSEYVAISYVCKGGQSDPRTIHLNGTPWKITQNLESALLHLRDRSRNVLLWVDALAINQNNIQERNNQVSIMQRIYSGAERTIIWLTPFDDPLVALYINLANLIASNKLLIDQVHLEEVPLWVLSCTLSISNLSYWRRVWVTQEVMFSHDVTIRYGARAIEYHAFSDLWSRLCEKFKYLPTRLNNPTSTLLTRVAEISARMMRFGPNALPQAGSALEGKYISLYDWQNFIPWKHASDLRDTVFAYHGCFPPAVRSLIAVDYYKPVEEIWTRMTRIFIEESKSLDIILKICDKTLSLPSWVPHWATARRSSPATQKDICASGQLPAFYHFLDLTDILHLHGVAIGIVESVASFGIESVAFTELDRMSRASEVPGSKIKEYVDFLCRDFNIHEDSAAKDDLIAAV
ncbi:hypothetical protein P152DRAFT_427800, partial [Eremomyces bilateralis CBS 781.70]